MKRTHLFFSFLLLVAATAACSNNLSPGKAVLPDGIDMAQVPQADVAGYLYFKSDPPMTLDAERLAQGRSPARRAAAQDIQLGQATIVVSRGLEDYAGILDFQSSEDAQTAWELFQAHSQQGQLWTMLVSPRMLLVSGSGEWPEAVKAAIESDRTVLLKDHDVLGWSLLTNLPASPPSKPVAAGVMDLDSDITAAVGKKTGIALNGVGNAFGFVRVDKLGFAIYKDGPIEVSTRIDDDYLVESGASVLLVSQSAYTSGLVAFMLSIIAERTQMELIHLGGTNARYRTVGDLHVILKNKGSLVYAAVAGTRQDAEALMLAALSD